MLESTLGSSLSGFLDCIDDCVGLHKRLRGDYIDDYVAITKLSTLEVVLVVDINEIKLL